MKSIPARSAHAGSCLTCEAPPKQRAALAAAMAVAASADGKLGPEERGYLRQGFAAIPAFAKLPTESIDQLVLEALGRIAREGPEATVVGIAQELPTPELRRSAFSLAASVALADDRLARSESETLDLLAAALGIDDAEAERIVGELRAL